MLAFFSEAENTITCDHCGVHRFSLSLIDDAILIFA